MVTAQSRLGGRVTMIVIEHKKNLTGNKLQFGAVHRKNKWVMLIHNVSCMHALLLSRQSSKIIVVIKLM